jgi:hypothetical protein
VQVSKVRSALTSKGFREQMGDHIFLIYHDLNGLRTSVRTKLSHGAKPKDLPSAMQSKMARQCGLSRSEFASLVSCSMSQSDFDNNRLWQAI